MKALHSFALCMTLLLFSSCQTQGHPPEPAAEPLDISWLASIGNWPGEDERLVQLVTFQDRRDSRIHIARYDVHMISGGSITMVAQTTLGIPLYECTFREGHLSIVRHQSGLEGLPLEPAIADFVLANWPLDQLDTALSSIGYTLNQVAEDRSLYDETGALRVEIRTDGSDDEILQITHHDIPLTIRVQTLERHPLP